MKWEEFFNEDYIVTSRYYENTETFTTEELYQAVKARLLYEIQEAAMQLGKDEAVILMQRVSDNGEPSR